MKRLGIALLVILGTFMVVIYFFLDPSKTAFFPKCPFLSLTGLYCPGCGSQRAVHHILQGEILEGIKYNLLFLLLAFVILYQAYRFALEKYRPKPVRNLLHRPIVTNGILIAVLLFWVFRNIPEYPFNLLAP